MALADEDAAAFRLDGIVVVGINSGASASRVPRELRPEGTARRPAILLRLGVR